MIIQIQNGPTAGMEWCILEFQGDICGDLDGSELGSLRILEVCTLATF